MHFPRKEAIIRKVFVYLQRKNNTEKFMETIKSTKEEALRRWRHSLEIKREWERKVEERWAREDQTANVALA